MAAMTKGQITQGTNDDLYLALSGPDECYSINVLCTLYSISYVFTTKHYTASTL